MTERIRRIYIPSRGRANVDFGNCCTIDHLPYLCRMATTLVVPPDEAEDYARRWPHLDVVAPEVSGIGPVRQWIVDTAAPGEVCLMMDDDMKFGRRADDWTPETFPTVDPISPEQVGAMVMAIFEKAEDYAMVGVSQRAGNNRHSERWWKESTRANNIYAVHADVLRENGITFTPEGLDVMEDFHVTLSLLKAGYPNVVSTNYFWGQMGSNAEGGCSTWRTNEIQRRSALRLQELHGEDLVAVIEKKSRSSWEGMETRTDVRIQWRRAISNAAKGMYR